jgi:hypothetical protein
MATDKQRVPQRERPLSDAEAGTVGKPHAGLGYAPRDEANNQGTAYRDGLSDDQDRGEKETAGGAAAGAATGAVAGSFVGGPVGAVAGGVAGAAIGGAAGASTHQARPADHDDQSNEGLAGGAVAGGATGAAVGAVVGGPPGAVVGAAIGGAVGAIAGAQAGAKQDNDEDAAGVDNADEDWIAKPAGEVRVHRTYDGRFYPEDSPADVKRQDQV